MLLKQEMNKKQKCFSLPDFQLAEDLVLILCFYKRTKVDKDKLATEFVAIVVALIFI